MTDLRGAVVQLFGRDDPMRSDVTLLAAALLTLGIPAWTDHFFHVTYEHVRGELRFDVIWSFRAESPDKRFNTIAMQRAWDDPAWLAANPAHPLAILRGLSFERALKLTPRFTVGELARIETPDTWIEAGSRNLVYLLRSIPRTAPKGIVRFGETHTAFVPRTMSEPEKLRFLKHVEHPELRVA